MFSLQELNSDLCVVFVLEGSGCQNVDHAFALFRFPEEQELLRQYNFPRCVDGSYFGKDRAVDRTWHSMATTIDGSPFLGGPLSLRTERLFTKIANQLARKHFVSAMSSTSSSCCSLMTLGWGTYL